jgi:hypothetical protein
MSDAALYSLPDAPKPSTEIAPPFDAMALLADASRLPPVPRSQRSLEIRSDHRKPSADDTYDQFARTVEAERAKLEKWIADQDPYNASDVNEALDKFATRAQRDGISAAGVLKTYQQIERLTAAKADAPLSHEQRLMLVEQTITRLGEPDQIKQGQNATCNASDVEIWSFYKNPSGSVRLIADIALKGQYKATDGTPTVTIAPQKLIAQADGRSYADQIFQTTAINVHLRSQNERTGKDLVYEKSAPDPKSFDDTGERLVDYSKHPPSIERFISLTPSAIAEMIRAINGPQTKTVMLMNADFAAAENVPALGLITSETDLAQQLAIRKENNDFPVIVFINAVTKPYVNAGSSVGHVFVITGFDQNTGQVQISDSSVDSSIGGGLALSVHDLYVATESVPNAEQSIYQSLQAMKAKPTSGDQKERTKDELSANLELLRLEMINHEIGSDEAEGYLRQYIPAVRSHQISDGPSESKLSQVELIYAMALLPLDARLRLLEKTRNQHVITEEDFADGLRILRRDFEAEKATATEKDKNAIDDYLRQIAEAEKS